MTDKSLEQMTKRELIEQITAVVRDMEGYRSSAGGLLTEIQSQRDSVHTFSAEIQKQRDSANTMSAEIQGQRDTANNLVVAIQEHRDGASSLAAEMQKRKDTANTMSAEIQGQRDGANNLSAEIQGQRDNANNWMAEMQTQRGNANALLAEIQSQRDNVSVASAEVKQQQENANALSEDMQNKVNDANALTQEMQGQINNASKLVSDAKRSIESDEKERSNLLREIEALLPGATSAELASTFLNARKQRWTILLFWGGFLSSLLAMVFVSYFTIPSDNILSWEYLLLRMPMGIPLIWIAWYCQRSLSQINRVREEYHHKERVMRIYHGFSKEIERLSESGKSSEQVLDFIKIVIQTIDRNPARVLDPSATMLDSMLRRNKAASIENDGAKS